MTYYAPKDQLDQIDYAKKVGKKILEYFEEYYNVSYPLPKAGKFFCLLYVVLVKCKLFRTLFQLKKASCG